MFEVRRKFSLGIAVCLAPLLWASACGGDDEAPAPSSGGSGGSGGRSTTGSGGTSAGGGPGAGGVTTSTGGVPEPTCDMTPCEGRLLQTGAPLPTCCIDATTCGLGVQGICLPVSSFDDLTRPDGGLLPPAETIVLDPACPDQVVTEGPLTLTFRGCCDKGICGNAIAEGGPFAQCLTPDDARAAGTPDAGVSVPCGSGGGSGGAAGTGGSSGSPDSGPSRDGG